MVEKKSNILGYVLFVATLVMVVSYFFKDSWVSIEEKIIEAVRTAPKEERVYNIDLNNVINFSWQRAYFFHYTYTRKSIEQEIGIPFPYDNDGGYVSIFINNDKVVHWEVYPAIPYDQKRDQLWIVFGNAENHDPYHPYYYYLTPDNAVLSVERELSAIHSFSYYTLSPSNENQWDESNPYRQR
ncbi:hypothetical protein [Serratia microhaemolytica]|uniref:hypothetical protein n=1 Tax=Serratia microhaemolytica TaxID=2675110 RepID=UPI000FDD4A28|nr:hypothetical protein [Serratia microhaemolytica]